MRHLIKSEKERRMDIDRIMSKQIDPNDFTPMNIHELRNYCYYGFSSRKHRPKYWKILLGYFSKNKFNTCNYYREKRKAYAEYIKGIDEHEKEHSNVFNVIHDDLSRTVIFPAVDEESGKKCTFLDGSSVNNQMNNRMVLERILKCFVVHNKSVGYIQGMHMLLIHIYYVMLHSEDTEDVRYSEEDSFFCFVSFISELFEQIISNVEQGGESMQVILNKIYNILEIVDPDLYKTCKDKKIFESGLCIKWIMFAFSSEFKVDSVIWLWDRLLSDKKRFEMIFYCAASVFVIMKDVICTEEVESCFEVLQSPSLIDVETIFNTADAMRLKVSKLPRRDAPNTSKVLDINERDSEDVESQKSGATTSQSSSEMVGLNSTEEGEQNTTDKNEGVEENTTDEDKGAEENTTDEDKGAEENEGAEDGEELASKDPTDLDNQNPDHLTEQNQEPSENEPINSEDSVDKEKDDVPRDKDYPEL